MGHALYGAAEKPAKHEKHIRSSLLQAICPALSEIGNAQKHARTLLRTHKRTARVWISHSALYVLYSPMYYSIWDASSYTWGAVEHCRTCPDIYSAQICNFIAARVSLPFSKTWQFEVASLALTNQTLCTNCSLTVIQTDHSFGEISETLSCPPVHFSTGTVSFEQ